MEDYKEGMFVECLDRAKSAYKNLATTYDEILLLINTLNRRVKRQMDLISAIDEGFDANEEESDFEKIGQLIYQELSIFNNGISENLNLFNRCIKDSIKNYKESLNYFNKEKTEISELLIARKTLLFLEALMRKFLAKVIKLQSALNILPNFNEEMKHAKKAFYANVKQLIVEVRAAEDNCLETAAAIEKVIGR